MLNLRRSILLAIPLIVLPVLVGAVVPEKATEGVVAPILEAPRGPTGKGGLKVVPSARKVSRVVVVGNRRVRKAKILQLLPMRRGSSITSHNENVSIKSLYASGLFADVSLTTRGTTLFVKVKENPIIRRIILDGNSAVDSKAIDRSINLKKGAIFTQDKLNADVRTMQRLYRFFGRYGVSIKPSVKDVGKNRVDVKFHFIEGDKTTIRKIRFVGNKVFSDRKLRGVMLTREWTFYRFLSSSVVYDPQRLRYDRQLLRSFYTSRGYADFSILDVTKDLSKDGKDIFITMTLHEGERYRVGTVNLSSNIDDIEADHYRSYVKVKSGDWYDSSTLESVKREISMALNRDGFVFTDVAPKIDLDQKTKQANLSFTIVPTAKVFIDHINIVENIRTQGQVIRRVMTIAEGDPLNYAKIRESRVNLYSLGFFKDIQITEVPSNKPQHVNLQTKVTEGGTTNFYLSGGLSTVNGVFAQLSFQDRNIFGTGNSFSSAFTVGQRNLSFSVNWAQPYAWYRDLTFMTSASYVLDTSYTVSSYKAQYVTLQPGFSYKLYRHWSQRPFYQFRIADIYNIASGASAYVREEEGFHLLSGVGQTLTYDRRNNAYSPTSGFALHWTALFAGVGGNERFLKNILRGEYFYPVTYDVTLRLEGSYGVLTPLGRKILLLDRFFLGGENLRGFAESAVGPRDLKTGDFLGGTQRMTSSLSLAFPLGLSKDIGLSGAVFTEWGTLFDPGEPNESGYTNTGTIRGDVGFALHWQSPIGLMSFSWAFPIVKEPLDITQVFRFSIGGHF